MSGLRIASLALAGGVLALAVGTLAHPFWFDPRDPLPVLRKGATAHWVVDHWGLFAGTLAAGAGLASFHQLLSRTAARAAGAAMATVAMGILLTLFAFEATGWHALAGLAANGSFSAAAGVDGAAQVVWRALLGLGHAAGVMAAIAVALWAAAAAHQGLLASWTAWVAGVGAGVVVLTTPVAWAVPAVGAPLAAGGYALLGVWMLVAAWRMWAGGGR